MYLLANYLDLDFITELGELDYFFGKNNTPSFSNSLKGGREPRVH